MINPNPKQVKMNDLKPFEHGQEGTHFACQERLEELGLRATCCGCIGHKCKEPKKVGCECCSGDIKIRNPKGYCDHLYYPENCNGNCTPPKEPEGDWEEGLKTYLTSAGDRRRAIHYFKGILSTKIREAELKGYMNACDEIIKGIQISQLKKKGQE